MILTVSPYHLTTREPAAMAALLLADRVVTFLPVPQGDITKAAVRRALHTCPRYLRLLESWRWSAALWSSGIINSTLNGHDALASVRDADTRVASHDAWAPLRRFRHTDLFAAEQQHLEALSADMLKGGPDPGVCMPVAAGLDEFAAEHQLIAVRAAGTPAGLRGSAGPSLAQRAEALLGQHIFSVAIPTLLSAGGKAILRAREMLEPELHPLREAMTLTLTESDAATIQARVRTAARALTDAFAAVRAELEGKDDEWGRRVTAGTVRIDARKLPRDAALRASLAAINTARRAPSSIAPASAALDLSALLVSPMDVR